MEAENQMPISYPFEEAIYWVIPYLLVDDFEFNINTSQTELLCFNLLAECIELLLLIFTFNVNFGD